MKVKRYFLHDHAPLSPTQIVNDHLGKDWEKRSFGFHTYINRNKENQFDTSSKPWQRGLR
jgi:hypothetical protein